MCVYVYIYSVRGVREDGVLWDIVQSGDIFDEQAARGYGGGVQQRHQLGGHRVFDAGDRSLHRRRFSRQILDLPHCLRRLSLGTYI